MLRLAVITAAPPAAPPVRITLILRETRSAINAIRSGRRGTGMCELISDNDDQFWFCSTMSGGE